MVDSDGFYPSGQISTGNGDESDSTPVYLTSLTDEIRWAC